MASKERIRYRIGKRYVKTPHGREVTVELWKGKKKRLVGQARSKQDADKKVIAFRLTTQGVNVKDIKAKSRRWDKAAQELARKAIKAGLRKGDDYEIWTGNKKAKIFRSHGGATLRSVASRKSTGAKSLAEEITREMFRLAKLRLHQLRITYETFVHYDLSTFHVKLLRKSRKRQSEKAGRSQRSQRSIRKTTPKAKRFSGALRGGKTRKKPIIRKAKSKKRRSTAKTGR